MVAVLSAEVVVLEHDASGDQLRDVTLHIAGPEADLRVAGLIGLGRP